MRVAEYPYTGQDVPGVDPKVIAVVLAALERLAPAPGDLADLGCGTGWFARQAATAGYRVVGVDASDSGIRHAMAATPNVRFERAEIDTFAAACEQQFDVLTSIEVIEHVYSVAGFCRSVHRLLKPGGYAVISTPYHGYAKNLLIALAGFGDRHFNPLWEGGHIKFFSPRTLRIALEAAQLHVASVKRVGRIGPLAKSMVAVARRAP